MSQTQVARSAAATVMLVSAEHPHQLTTPAIAAAIGRAKRLTDFHCVRSSRVNRLGLKCARQIDRQSWGRDGYLTITFAPSYYSRVLLLPPTASVDALCFWWQALHWLVSRKKTPTCGRSLKKFSASPCPSVCWAEPVCRAKS